MRYLAVSLLVLVVLILGNGSCLAIPPEVQNPEVWESLNRAQQQALETNGFVVVPESVPQIYTLYQDVSGAEWPVFVTTDAVLHTYHVFYDFLLRQAEYEIFVPDLEALNLAMLEASLAQMQEPLPGVQLAARDNVGFFAVAQQLLNPGGVVPAEVEDIVRAELELIMAHEGIVRSPLLDVDEDYSQYVPRGHYTRNEVFQRYFRAMMWLGRMAFLLKPGDGPEAIENGRHRTRQALLIVYALQNSSAGNECAWAKWERIYLPTSFFVGKTDDLNLYDYRSLMAEVYGDQFKPTDLEDVARLDQFIDAALKLPPPRIVSSPVTDQEDAAVVTKGFRFMGQRFVFDSYIFQQLVYDRVGIFLGTGQPFTSAPAPFGLIRGFPRGLDVASVFGSDRALEIMQTYGDTDYEGYDAQMAALRREVESLPAEQWSENLYWSWLYSLRPLLQVKGDRYPAFMRGQAWLDKDLHTFLGSWTELRHDTILYAKQSMTLAATAAQPEPRRVTGYVEPQPELYARLAILCEQMKEGLKSYRALDPQMESKLGQWIEILRSLETISLKELRGESLADEEYYFIQNFGDIMEGLTSFFARDDEGKMSNEVDEQMALVADVHTDSNSGQVLEEAVGDAFQIFVLVPGDGGVLTAVGGIFSYYEFRQPMEDRLTDEAWQALVPKPPRPEWTASFIVE